MITRLILASLAALFLGMAPASARQLAVGAAAGYVEPPGYVAVPVYTWPNGRAWTPADTSMGYVFREPVYSTPRGYRYVYVRGYYWKRLPVKSVPRKYRRVVKTSATPVRRSKPRRAPCVTDLGYGRHELCGRYY